MAIHELGYILSMKRYSLISLMLASALCSIVRRAEAATNLLAIHLMAEKADREAVLAGTRRVEDVELVPDPLLSDHDFISYDRTNHIFAVTAEAAKRLSMSMMRRDGPSLTTDGKKVYHFDGPDMPFVLFVSG